MQLLLVEDERPLSDALVALLLREGYLVDAVYDGLSGLDYARSGIHDAVILDIMLPGMDGLSVLRTLREEEIAIPILLLTARGEVRERIAGLDHGADDYLTKPFDTGELLARVRAITRRKGVYAADDLAVGRTVLRRGTRELCCEGSSMRLGLKEYQIMELLMQNSRQVIPRGLLMERVWGFDADAEYNAVEVYISFLRKKLAAIQSDLQVRAVRGVGYLLEAQA